MRKLTAVLFIVLCVSVNTVFPNFNYTIGGGATHTFYREVSSGSGAAIIRGDGSSNLDLYVYYGNTLVGRCDDGDDYENAGFTTNGGTITILVVNRGSYANNYQTNF